MLSESQYRGKLPYNIYKQRFKASQTNLQEELQKKIEEKTKSIPSKIPSIPKMPTQEHLKEIAKAKLKKELQKKTGLNTDKISKLIDDIGGKAKNKEDERKKENILTGISLSRALRPSHEDITIEERDRAKLNKASKIAYQNDDNFQTAQDYMDTHNLGVIDKELSTKQGLVVKRPNGNIELAFRGTMLTPKPDLEDLTTDLSIASDSEGTDPQFIKAREMLNNAKLKYGTVDHITGYSKGGAIGLHLAQRENIPSTTFNTFIGQRLARGNTNTTEKHNIIRTTEDPVSVGLAFTKNSNLENWNVKTIKTRAKYQSNIPGKSSYEAHRLENFTELLPPAEREALETEVVRKLKNVSKKQAQTVTVKRIQELKSQNEGLTFSDNIWDLQKRTDIVFTGDNDIGGTEENPILRGNRHFTGDPQTQVWKALGGEFTEKEASIINQNHELKLGRMPSMPPTSPSPTFHRDKLKVNFEEYENLPDNHYLKETSQNILKPNEIRDIASKTPDELQEHNENLLQEQANHQEDMAEIQAPKEQVVGISEVARAFNPVHLGIGYAIGSGTNEALDLIPGFKSQNKYLQEVEAGSIGAGLTSGFQAALGGGLRKVGATTAAGLLGESAITSFGASALAPEALAGAAGYIAGEEGSKLIKQGIQKLGGGETAQEAGSDIGGGFVGGLAGGLTAFGTAVAADALFGTELGTVFGPEGTVVGGLIGAGVGTLAFGGSEAIKGVKAGFSALKKLF